MRRINAGRTLVPAIAFLLITGVAVAVALNLTTPEVAEAQTEPNTAANGIALPPLDYDPVAARSDGAAAGTTAAGTTAAGTPTPADPAGDGPTAAGAPDSGSAMTTSLGGADVAVSSVGGSYEVDRPSKRSRKK